MSELERYDQEIYALDERIARLAMVCGADLSRREMIVALIKGNYAACTRSDALSQARREELRALLMLKYNIEARCIDSIGAAECGRLIDEEEERLRRRGLSQRGENEPPPG